MNINLPPYANIKSFVNFFNKSYTNIDTNTENNEITRNLMTILENFIENQLIEYVRNGLINPINTHNFDELLKDSPIETNIKIIAKGYNGNTLYGYGIHFIEFEYQNNKLYIIIPIFWGDINKKFKKFDIKTKNQIKKINNIWDNKRYTSISYELYLNFINKTQTFKKFNNYLKAYQYLKKITDFWNIDMNYQHEQ